MSVFETCNTAKSLPISNAFAPGQPGAWFGIFFKRYKTLRTPKVELRTVIWFLNCFPDLQLRLISKCHTLFRFRSKNILLVLIEIIDHFVHLWISLYFIRILIWLWKWQCLVSFKRHQTLILPSSSFWSLNAFVSLLKPVQDSRGFSPPPIICVLQYWYVPLRFQFMGVKMTCFLKYPITIYWYTNRIPDFGYLNRQHSGIEIKGHLIPETGKQF